MNRSIVYIFSLLTAIVFISACSSKPKSEPVKLPTTLEEAAASTYRTPPNNERDQYRHPVKTLTFFGIKPDMTVVEISPAQGWYAEILAPYLAAKGQYYAATIPATTTNEHLKEMNTKFTEWLKAHPDVESKTKITTFNPAAADVMIAPEGSVDMVLTFRNVHNWMANGTEKAAFKSFFKSLKPGGILGVVEHRADAKSKKDSKAKNGYVREKDVIKLAKSVGFKLAEKSEINANPKDTKNYTEGVWTLPPTLKLKEKDRDKYVAIGESDRMTLRFVKPGAKKMTKPAVVAPVAKAAPAPEAKPTEAAAPAAPVAK